MVYLTSKFAASSIAHSDFKADQQISCKSEHMNKFMGTRQTIATLKSVITAQSVFQLPKTDKENFEVFFVYFRQLKN